MTNQTETLLQLREEIAKMKKQMHSVGGGDIGGYIDIPDDAYNRMVEIHNQALSDVLHLIDSKLEVSKEDK